MLRLNISLTGKARKKETPVIPATVLCSKSYAILLTASLTKNESKAITKRSRLALNNTPSGVMTLR